MLNVNLDAIFSNCLNKKILLSISGGVDSVVLLDLLNKSLSSKSIYLLHINYNMHSMSSDSLYLCKKLADKYNNKIFILEANLKKNNFEHIAREFRYKALKSYADKYNIDKILTAHHLDDQLETLYMQKYIFKSHWVSMQGIRKNYGKIYRPLLEVKKTSIYKYAKDNNLIWIEDDTNKNISFLRNRVRHELLPNIKKNIPNICEDLILDNNNSKISFTETMKKIENDMNLFIKKNRSQYLIIDNSVIENYNENNVKLFYQSLIKKIGYSSYATNSHWSNLYSFIKESKPGSKFYLSSDVIIFKDRKFHHIIFSIYYNKIKTLKNLKKIKLNKISNRLFDNSIIRKASKNFNITIPLNLYDGKIYLRYWRHGDVCYSDYYNCNIKVKKLFTNNKIPLIDKLRTPILVDSNDKILSIPNIYNYNLKNNCVKMYWSDK